MPKITLSTTFKNADFSEIYNFAKKTGFDGLDYDMTLSTLFRKNKLTEEQKKFIACLHEPREMILFESDFFLNKTLEKIKNISSYKNPVLNFHLFNFKKPFFLNGDNLIKKIVKNAKKLSFIPTFESGTINMAHLVEKVGTDPKYFSEFCLKNDLNMTLDVSHLGTFGVNIVSFFKEYHSRIKLIHLSDYGNGVQHMPLFTGKLPIKELLLEIKKLKWNETIAFEIFKFKADSKSEKFKILENNLKEVRKILK